MVASIHNLETRATEWTYEDACTFARHTKAVGKTHKVTVNLSDVSEVATAAFARLIELRRELRQAGGELRVTGLHSRAKARYDIYHLQGVLPLESALP